MEEPADYLAYGGAVSWGRGGSSGTSPHRLVPLSSTSHFCGKCPVEGRQQVTRGLDVRSALADI